jgi:ornithine carbamoyltransferase
VSGVYQSPATLESLMPIKRERTWPSYSLGTESLPMPAFSFPHPWSLDTLPVSERQRVMDTAALLEQNAASGQQRQALRGKNLAVLCESADDPALLNMRRAAGALGAQVTHIRPSDALNPSSRSADSVGHLLGRLYDAIDCHGLSVATVEQLRRTTGCPVFNALGRNEGLGTGNPEDAEFVLQALLLRALT